MSATGAPIGTEREAGSLLAPPRWLRALATSAWLIAGIALVTVAAVWLLSLTQTIVMPVITAGVVAAVASPIVGALKRRGVGRGLGAVIVLLGFVVAAVLLVVLVTAGVLSQSDDLNRELTAGLNQLGQWLHDAGVSSAQVESAEHTASEAAKNAVPALLHGITDGIEALSSLVFFLSLTALSILFLLMDGPSIRSWAE